MPNNTGIKGGSVSRSRDRNLSRELNRAAPNSLEHNTDICDPIIYSTPFSKNAERRRNDELKGGPQVGMGKSNIKSDHRTDCLISDKSERLNHHGDRMDEHGGFIKDGINKTDMAKGNQGNTIYQPSDGKGKYNKANAVMNSDDSI